MTRLALLVLIVLLLSATSAAADDACGGDDYGTAGDFDLYVLSQSWSAEFCSSSSHSGYPGCEQPTDWQQVNLTLHGLWPQYTSVRSGHDWPQCCPTTRGEALNKTVISDRLTGLQLYWPNEEDPSGSDLSASLWAHEWAKHGTCSNLSQANFIDLALSGMVALPTPAVIQAAVGFSVSLSDLEAAYNGGSSCADDSCWVWVQCSGSWLTEVHTCWSVDGVQVVCPKLVVSESGRCKTGSKVKVASFDAKSKLQRAHHLTTSH